MIKFISLFSGIGAPEMALKNLNIPFELVGFSEVDPYAEKQYCAIHGVSPDMNLGDITLIDETALEKDIDLLTGGFPCQDVSISGKNKGAFDEDGNKTRSGLAYDMLRIIKETQPKVIITENVKNLVSKKHYAFYEDILAHLSEYGYENYAKVLNAKNYGIPQNRKRVFIVSIRKDVSHDPFEFPQAKPLLHCLKDFLEETVEEKYYLSERLVEFFKKNEAEQKAKGNGFRFDVTTGGVQPKL